MKQSPHCPCNLTRLLGCVLLLLQPNVVLPAVTNHHQAERPMELKEKLTAAYLAKG